MLDRTCNSDNIKTACPTHDFLRASQNWIISSEIRVPSKNFNRWRSHTKSTMEPSTSPV